MKIAIGSDEKSWLTTAVIAAVQGLGHDVSLHGPLAAEDLPWPQVALEVAEAVSGGAAEEGILFCWTGTGVTIVANKVPGIRAALCDDAETARGARLWNDANLLCLSLRRTSPVIAAEILESWFNTTYEANESDDACLRQVTAVERRYFREE
jgi:ribose 5-phosphate isomerase B